MPRFFVTDQHGHGIWSVWPAVYVNAGYSVTDSHTDQPVTSLDQLMTLTD